LLVPPGDAAALGAALRRWLSDAELRARLRRAARQRRASLRGWDATAAAVARVLTEVAAVVAR
jgi:glycosyltransferase involved in cell wall biosynthesis